MQFLKLRGFVLLGIISLLGLAAATLPVIAEDRDPSMEQLTQAAEVWGLELREKVVAHLQQTVATEIVLQYEQKLAQQAADDMDQVALAVSIDPRPIMEQGELLANVIPVVNEVECNN